MSLSTPAASLTYNAPWKFRYASEMVESWERRLRVRTAR